MAEEKKSVEAWIEELEGLVKEEKWEELLDAAKGCIKAFPEEAVGHFSMGLSKDELGDHEEAIQSYNRAIELNSTIAAFYQNRGNAFARTK